MRRGGAEAGCLILFFLVCAGFGLASLAIKVIVWLRLAFGDLL